MITLERSTEDRPFERGLNGDPAPGPLGFVTGIHNFQHMQRVLGSNERWLAGQKRFRHVGGATHPIVLAWILAESFQHSLSLIAHIHAPRTPVPALHLHCA